MSWPTGKQAHNRIKDVDGSRVCTKCGESKPITEYYKTGKGDKRHGSCKTCYKAKVAQNKDPAKIRDRGLQKAYGITSEEYERMLESQGGCCAICKCPPPDHRKKFLAVDHDHVTGKVRGLLCDNCNRGIGLLGDSLDRILDVVEYLRDSVEESPESPRSILRRAAPHLWP